MKPRILLPVVCAAATVLLVAAVILGPDSGLPGPPTPPEGTDPAGPAGPAATPTRAGAEGTDPAANPGTGPSTGAPGATPEPTKTPPPRFRYDFRKPSDERGQIWARAPKGADDRWIWENVANATGITALDLMETKITDAMLVEIGKLGKLEVLKIRFRKEITDKGIRQLGRLENLRELMLGGTDLTDEGLAGLDFLTKLEVLYLWQTGITDEGLAHLRKMKKLRILFASNTKIRGPGLRYLAECPLEVLWLGGCPVADDTARYVGALAGLENLDLHATSLTDEGLRTLHHLTKLRRLAIRGTKVTKEAVEELKEKAPGLAQIH